MIAFRKKHPNLRRERFFTGEPNEHGVKDIEWHGLQLFTPDWHDPNSRMLAFTIWGLSHDNDLHVILNMEKKGINFEIPSLQGRRWLRVIDTALPSPMDIVERGKEKGVRDSVGLNRWFLRTV